MIGDLESSWNIPKLSANRLGLLRSDADCDLDTHSNRAQSSTHKSSRTWDHTSVEQFSGGWVHYFDEGLAHLALARAAAYGRRPCELDLGPVCRFSSCSVASHQAQDPAVPPRCDLLSGSPFVRVGPSRRRFCPASGGPERGAKGSC